jgi:hypothetical protein
VATHPEQPEVRVLATTKMKVAARPQPLGFQLRPHANFPCAYIDWQGPVNMTADQLLNTLAVTTEGKERQSRAEFCEQLLRGLLELNGEMWSNELYQIIVVEEKVGKVTYDSVRAAITYAWRVKKEDGTQGYRVRLK